MSVKYPKILKKQLCENICLNGNSTLKTADDYGIPIKTLEKWITAFNKDNHCFDSDDNPNDLSIDELKKLSCDETRWYGKKGVRFFLQKEFEVILQLSDKKGDPNTYHNGLKIVLHKKEEYLDLVTILHSDQGSVYSSKKFNESLNNYNIIHSMSKPGKPTENGAMEAINGWVKEELFIDFKINSSNNVFSEIDKYIHYFNYERPQAALNYLTPIQFKQLHTNS